MQKYFLKKDQFDSRDHVFARMPILEPLPTLVDLRLKCSPVVNQGSLGSCSSNAIGSGLKEYLILKSGQPFVSLSRLYLYYKEREMEGTINEDAGACLRDGMKIMAATGICEEQYMPYIIEKFQEKPSNEAEINAANHKFLSYQRLLSLNDVKRCLHDGYPVIGGIYIYESFESPIVAKTGIVPMPKPKEQSYGGHAICIVGYKDGKSPTDGYFIVRNSWGETWGDKGYCYIPYNFLTKSLMFDMWSAK
jgi:C1A family cysteine protease